MSFETIAAQGTATVTLTANQKIAVKTAGEALVYQVVGFPNYPSQNDLIQTVTDTIYTSSAFTDGATIIIEAGAYPVLYAVGTNPVVGDDGDWQHQATPNALNSTGTLTAAMMLGGIVTSSTGAAVTATPDTGAIIDAASSLAVDDSFDFYVINTGGANTFTVSVGGGVAGITIVGSGAVAHSTSGHFRVRKTAADTFTIYRMS